jgi:uncharacterized protein DUF4286
MVLSHRPGPSASWRRTGPGDEHALAEGLITAQHWRSIHDDGLMLSLYDTEHLGKAGADRHRSFISREMDSGRDAVYECDQLHPGDLAGPGQAGFLYLIRLRVDPSVEAEWNRWYNEEHVPRLAAVTGVVCARRFKARQPDAGGRNYLATYHLTAADIPQRAEWKAASDSAWSRRMKPHHQPGKILNLFARTSR